MVEYPDLTYELTVSSVLPLPVSTSVQPTRTADAFAWDTVKLLGLVEENFDNPFEDKSKQSFRRIQDKGKRWIIIDYTIWSRKKAGKKVRLVLYQRGWRKEFRRRKRVATVLAEKISPILYQLDPMDLSGAPPDEYDSEAEMIAERVVFTDEELSPPLLKEVFEYMFTPGCCEEEVYERIVEGLRTVVKETVGS